MIAKLVAHDLIALKVVSAETYFVIFKVEDNERRRQDEKEARVSGCESQLFIYSRS